MRFFIFGFNYDLIVQNWVAGGRSQRMAQPFFGWGFGCEMSAANLTTKTWQKQYKSA